MQSIYLKAQAPNLTPLISLSLSKEEARKLNRLEWQLKLNIPFQ